MAGHFTEEDGHRLAADMLREIREHVGQRWEAESADNKDQNSAQDAEWRKDDGAILRRYIETVGKFNDRAVSHGFYSAITEFVGSNLNGVSVDPEYFASSVA